jgi:hypothetical protein
VLVEYRTHGSNLGGDAERNLRCNLEVAGRYGRAHGDCAACRAATTTARLAIRSDYYVRLCERSAGLRGEGKYVRAMWVRAYASYRFPESMTRIPRRMLEKIFPSMAAAGTP